MTLRINSVIIPEGVERSLFLSASIPDPERWSGDFDALEITDAVVAVARTFLTAGWRLVTAAHPTIAPLLLYVAGELPVEGRHRVVTYQSSLFQDVLPTATRRFEADGTARFEWTPAAEGERPEPGSWDQSLLIMRERMISEAKPDAAVFIGGMSGIHEEYRLFGDLRPQGRRYPLGGPGGAAREIAVSLPPSRLRDAMVDRIVFPAVARWILNDVQ